MYLYKVKGFKGLPFGAVIRKDLVVAPKMELVVKKYPNAVSIKEIGAVDVIKDCE